MHRVLRAGVATVASALIVAVTENAPSACTAFCAAAKDGTVLVGNNEDWFNPRTKTLGFGMFTLHSATRSDVPWLEFSIAPPYGRSASVEPTMLRGDGVTLIAALSTAYDIPAIRISGPDWLRTTRYAITASPMPTRRRCSARTSKRSSSNGCS